MLGTGVLIKDFAACIDHDRKFNKTCSHPDRSYEWVGVYQFEDVITDEERARRFKKNRDQESVVCQKVYGIFAFSTRKGDVVFDQTVQRDLVSVLRTGRLPEGSKCEWYFEGK